MNRINKAPLMAFVLGLGFVTVMGMSSFKTDSNLAANYYYNGAPEAWTSAGADAADQTAGNYTTITPSTSYTCANVHVVCTYDFIDGKFVLNSRGQNSLQ